MAGKKQSSATTTRNSNPKRPKIVSASSGESSESASSTSTAKRATTLPFRDYKKWTDKECYAAEKFMQKVLRDEMVTVDQHSDEQAWTMYIDEHLEFPFRARTEIFKADGTSTKHILDVVGTLYDEYVLTGDKVFVQVDYNGILMTYDICDLEPIDASDDMLRALQIWQYSLGMDIDTEYICNVDPSDLEEED